MDRPWVAGFDVGDVNACVTFMERETLLVKEVIKFDMTVWEGEKHVVPDNMLGTVVHRWMSYFSKQILKCSKAGIEDQPKKVTCGNNTRYRLVQAHFESALLGMYPHLEEVRLTNTKEIRKKNGTGGAFGKKLTGKNKGHCASKKRGIAGINISSTDMKRLERNFVNVDTRGARRVKIDDAVDSMEVAKEIAYNYDASFETLQGVPTKGAEAIVLTDVQMYLSEAYVERADAINAAQQTLVNVRSRPMGARSDRGEIQKKSNGRTRGEKTETRDVVTKVDDLPQSIRS